MKEFRKRVDAVGRKFLESEISRGFPYLGRIGYDKVRNALAWIDSLSGIDKEKLVDDLFSLSSEGSLLVEELKGMVGGAVGPRFKFETRKKFLSNLGFACSDCDGPDGMVSLHWPKFRWHT